jgi:hypothetical protein
MEKSKHNIKDYEENPNNNEFEIPSKEFNDFISIINKTSISLKKTISYVNDYFLFLELKFTNLIQQIDYSSRINFNQKLGVNEQNLEEVENNFPKDDLFEKENNSKIYFYFEEFDKHLKFTNDKKKEYDNIRSLIINEIQDDNQSSKLVNHSILHKNYEFLLEKHDKKRRNNNLGRKRKNSSEKGAHNKYTSDNLIRKCKAVMINVLGNLINKKINENYTDELTFQNKKRKLMKMHQYQIVNSNIKYNQLFLNKTLKEIFSENLSTRCTTFPQEHNKDLVNDLLNEKDLKKKEIFENFLFF